MKNSIVLMKSTLLVALLLFVASYTNAQVGVNSQSKASLDIISNAATSYPDGIIAPRLTGATVITSSGKYGVNQNGALVYVTDTTGTSANSTTSQMVNIGYYYWDFPSSLWQQLTTPNTAWVLGGNALGGNTNAGTKNQLGTTDNTNLLIGTGSGGSSSFITALQLTPTSSGAATVSTVNDMYINGILVGKVGNSSNTVVGANFNKNGVSPLRYNTFMGAGIASGSGLSAGVAGNTIVGDSAATQLTSGGHNIYLGCNAGQKNNGNGNIIIGVGGGTMSTSPNPGGTGKSNIFIGNYAGDNLTTGSGNVVIGSLAGVTTDSNTVIIGSGGDPTKVDNNYQGSSGMEYMRMMEGTTTGTSPKACVGIGGAPVQGEALYVNGQISSTYTIITTSDKRLKTNIKNLTVGSGIATVMQLRPVLYDKKINMKASTYTIKNEMGFIAQEIIKACPNVVAVGKDADQLMSVRYAELVPVLTLAIQEQHAVLEAHQKQLDELRNRVNLLTKEQ